MVHIKHNQTNNSLQVIKRPICIF